MDASTPPRMRWTWISMSCSQIKTMFNRAPAAASPHQAADKMDLRKIPKIVTPRSTE